MRLSRFIHFFYITIASVFVLGGRTMKAPCREFVEPKCVVGCSVTNKGDKDDPPACYQECVDMCIKAIDMCRDGRACDGEICHTHSACQSPAANSRMHCHSKSESVSEICIYFCAASHIGTSSSSSAKVTETSMGMCVLNCLRGIVERCGVEFNNNIARRGEL